MKSLHELMSLKGKVALITGGAGHIGCVLAQALAELGANIVLLDINKEQLDEKAKDIIEKYKVKVHTLEIDLSLESSVRCVPELISKEFGRLDIIVNCAALVGTSDLKGWAVPFEKQSSDTWRKALEINLTAAFVLIQSCKEMLTSSDSASIINISSIYGMVGPDMKLYEGSEMGNPAAYAVSKAGLSQLTRWLATTLAPGIRVNTISVGGVLRGHKDIFISHYKERTPLKRMAKEEDLKGAVAYLASGLSSYVTGHNLVVDGGWVSW